MLQLRSPSSNIKQAAFPATGATVAKTPFVQGGKVYIPINDADAAERSNHVYESEVSDAPKVTAEAWAVSQKIYWDDAAKKFTTTVGANVLCGYALDTALAADTVTPLFAFNSFAV